MYEELAARQRQPLLVVISGPSGVGKDTVLQRMKDRGLPFHFVVTATTRAKRPKEIEGVDYFFVTQEEFERMIEEGELIEHALVYQDLKGIPKQQIREALASGSDAVMRVDVQGAETIRKLYPEALLIFLSTRTEEELIERLKRRRTEDPEELALRLNTARSEYEYLDIFDYCVINADSEAESAVDTILTIIEAEHHRTNPRRITL